MIDITSTDLGESPFCIAVLSLNEDTQAFRLEQVNSTFEACISPRFKIQEALKEISFFQVVATNEKHQLQLQTAVQAVQSKKEDTARANSIEVLTLADKDSGFPIKKQFDWIVTRGGVPNTTVLYGNPCNDKTLEQREKDAELVDFFHNAPIALHWLSGEGIVLWANKRELDVLGYTEEEYIGQPIMNFCPDEKELVLEIFQQLGSGNTIKDVPVRFRTKQGKTVHLLIDSNVKYDDFGNFQHTRCFIRDDTGRKIHEAKAQLLLEETKRSLKMLDNFMSRSLHHFRTPLHILQCSIDLVVDHVHKMKRFAVEEKVSKGFQEAIQESESLLQVASEHLHKSVEMIEDISDLAKLDQQQEIQLNHELLELKVIGQQVFRLIDIPEEVEASLEFQGGGSTHLNTDKRYLLKVLRHLLDHCANGKDPEYNFCDQPNRHISLIVGNAGNVCIFQVIVAVGKGLTSTDILRAVKPTGGAASATKDDSGGTELPPVFQKYHQELLPSEINDYNKAGGLRNKIEAGINSQRFDSLHLGLSLSYHWWRPWAET